MTTFTKEQLIAKAREQIAFCRHTKITGEGRTHVDQCSALFEIALSSLAAEPVYQWRERYEDSDLWDDCTKEQYEGFAKQPEIETRILYTAPQSAPVVMQDHQIRELVNELRNIAVEYHGAQQLREHIAKAVRAAMQGKAEPVSNRDELQDDTRRLDWLDAQNMRLNEYYGTSYGWKFDANFQRNAMMLNDSNYPVMTVRQAIDEAIAAPRQEVKNG
jgi:hypothetical protein